MNKELPLHSVFISHAWGGISDEVTDALTAKFRQKNIPYVIDKSHLGYRGSIQEFMIELGKADMVIIILSNKYLQSEFCMFELIQIYKNDRLRDRIFPIVLDEVQISKSTDRIELVKYWENQIELLQSKLKELNSLSHIEGITEDLNLYTEIRNNIAKLTSILRDINSLNLRMHSDSDFEILCQSILSKLDGNKQNELPVSKPKLLNSIHTSKVWIKWAGLAFVAVFLILGFGKFIFGKETKDQITGLPLKNIETTASADSIQGKIESFMVAGNLYFPDKDCAWRSYKQLEKLFPGYSNLATIKTDLVSKLIIRTNELLSANSPFEAQLLVQKIHDLEPQNKSLPDLLSQVNHQKENLSKAPKTELKMQAKTETKSTFKPGIQEFRIPLPSLKSDKPNSDLVVVTRDPNFQELDPEIKLIETGTKQKTDHKSRVLTIPSNEELVLAANQEFSSDDESQLNKLYYFRVVKPLVLNGVVAISQNDKAEMKITKMKRSDFKRSGTLEFVISKLILSNGSNINLKSSNFLLKADGDFPMIISKGQQFKVKTAQAVTIEK